jgi:hypothetical protein
LRANRNQNLPDRHRGVVRDTRQCSLTEGMRGGISKPRAAVRDRARSGGSHGNNRARQTDAKPDRVSEWSFRS